MRAASISNALRLPPRIYGENATSSPYAEQCSPYAEQCSNRLLQIGTNLVPMRSSQGVFDSSISPYEHIYLDIYQAVAFLRCSPALDPRLLTASGSNRRTSLPLEPQEGQAPVFAVHEGCEQAGVGRGAHSASPQFMS
jgi:hypothetical protein